ncbi:MAG: adenylate/guanylate cyclase domain-containing protein [Rhodospirillales bacterium]
MNRTADKIEPGPGRADGGQQSQDAAIAFAQEALNRDKAEALRLSVKVRFYALGVIAVLLPFINPTWEVLYYEAILIGFAAIGWAQSRIGRVGRSRAELALIFCDLLLMTITCVAPSPFDTVHWPLAMQYRLDNFIYFFVLLAGATLIYSWRTVFAMGIWVGLLWIGGLVLVSLFAQAPDPALANLTLANPALAAMDPRMASILDPYSLQFELRAQEIVVFAIVAAMLAIVVRRANRLLLDQAVLQRERSNLARYFSPNVVEELSQNDEPLKQVRSQTVAVLFVDIVGFTEFAAQRRPEAVIETLRSFHGLMEREVFRHEGTLDKYLGDGLMATFGTPNASGRDAANALACAHAMQGALETWNRTRAARGEQRLRAGFGLHYGPVVLGDIGANRLEFAVIGNTVNVASRLETLSRPLAVTLVASDDLVEAVRLEVGDMPALAELQPRPPQAIRGLEAPLRIWVAT